MDQIVLRSPNHRVNSNESNESHFLLSLQTLLVLYKVSPNILVMLNSLYYAVAIHRLRVLKGFVWDVDSDSRLGATTAFRWQTRNTSSSCGEFSNSVDSDSGTKIYRLRYCDHSHE